MTVIARKGRNRIPLIGLLHIFFFHSPRSMKSLLAVLALAFAGAASAQRASATDEVRLDALAAFARAYGVVRYFHPSDSLDEVDWNRFLVHGAARMGEVTDARDIAARLEELFTPAVDAFRVVPAGTPAIAPRGEGPAVEWRHLGYGLEDRQTPFVSWRTHHDPLLGKKASPGYFQNQGRAEASVDEEPVARVPVAPGLEAHVPVSMRSARASRRSQGRSARPTSRARRSRARRRKQPASRCGTSRGIFIPTGAWSGSIGTRRCAIG
jgi:hypothetical protein